MTEKKDLSKPIFVTESIRAFNKELVRLYAPAFPETLNLLQFSCMLTLFLFLLNVQQFLSHASTFIHQSTKDTFLA